MTTAAVPSLCGGVLVASANPQLRERVLRRLAPPRAPIGTASGGAEAFAKLDQGEWQMLILDRQLPDLNAEELLELTNRLYPAIQVLLVDSRTEDAKYAEAGASQAELDAHGIVHGFSRSLQETRSASENVIQRAVENNTKEQALPGMIGDAESMRRVYRMVRLVVRRNTTELIPGPSGCGNVLVPRPSPGPS